MGLHSRMTRPIPLAALACIAVGGLTGCAGTTGGTAMPVAPVPATTAEALPSLLLSAADLGARVGAAEMVVTREVSAPWNDSMHFQGPGESGCLAIAGAAQKSVYADSGWTALHGQVLREPPGAAQWSHFATQAVVLFPTAAAAQEFFSRSRNGWESCADRELNYAQQPAPDQVWTVGPVRTDRDLLTVSRSQRSPEAWSCQRALTVRSNVAVDVEACSLDGPTTAAATIADAIGARLPAA